MSYCISLLYMYIIILISCKIAPYNLVKDYILRVHFEAHMAAIFSSFRNNNEVINIVFIIGSK